MAEHLLDRAQVRAAARAATLAYGQDALWKLREAYAALMESVGATLSACKSIVRFFYDNKDQLLNGMRSGEIVAAMMWDTGGWTLNRQDPNIQFIVPKSGAMGWLDTFALPARGRNDAAAYAWINFTMRPDVAAKITNSVGNWTAARGTENLVNQKFRAQFNASFPRSRRVWRKPKGGSWIASRPPIEYPGSQRRAARQALR